MIFMLGFVYMCLNDMCGNFLCVYCSIRFLCLFCGVNDVWLFLLLSVI